MKHISLIIVLLTSLMMSGCLKKYEDLGFSATTTYTGRVVTKGTQTGLSGITVAIVAGSTSSWVNNAPIVYTQTDNNGKFVLSVKYDQLPTNGDFLHLKFSGKDIEESSLDLVGWGKEQYDYGTIGVLPAGSYEFIFGGKTCIIGPISSKGYSWDNAWDYVNSLSYANSTGWTMPTLAMVKAINKSLNNHSRFISIENVKFWAYEESEAEEQVYPYRCYFYNTSVFNIRDNSVHGDLSYENITTGTAYVLPVRIID